MSRSRITPSASGSNPKSVVDDAIAALAVWSVATETSVEMDINVASDLQVAAAAIDESLGAATEEAPDVSLLYGRMLVRLLDSALWNFGAGECAVAPRREALIVTARLATVYLRRASIAFEHAAGGVQ